MKTRRGRAEMEEEDYEVFDGVCLKSNESDQYCPMGVVSHGKFQYN